jgi:hypothetical protein
MSGQHQDVSNDGSHTVTIGSTDGPVGTAFVSQQDNQGNKLTTVYDSQGNIVKEFEKPKP